ncbi:acetylornithine deacetylase [Sulfitobacter sp. S190]|uniref:acetylornithine deacetylase n=1 Tax=Sulfitobacter sp. S190 TaxID=2867022 RepID=UPI0021A474C9|nr:acetylornithine deacetylase [Sulfitobacter sp. S190]UWR24247.1 acetylornithine deacetylase [Sulfitobacter sp. S190]
MGRTLEILERLVGFATVSHDSNLDLIDWTQDLLENAGFEVTRIGSPEGTKAGLFARIGPRADGGICLSAHTDVVPVDGQVWTRAPFRLSDEGARVFGRGTTDMKGFLASALAMAERAGSANLSAPLSLCISYDEEIGCVGIRQMMPEVARHIGKPRLVIVGEPTSMQVATGHKGKTALRVTCHGQAGHSALAPQFVNAIHVAAEMVEGLRRLQAVLADGPRDDAYAVAYSTVHIGKIAGGQALNIVPSDTHLDVEFRHLAETPAEDIVGRITDLAHRVSRSFPDAPAITVEKVNAYPGLETDVRQDAVAWAAQLAGATNTVKVPFGTEAGYFAQLGLCSVVVGPGDMAADGHKPDEGLSKTELAACDAMMDNILGALTSRR